MDRSGFTDASDYKVHVHCTRGLAVITALELKRAERRKCSRRHDTTLARVPRPLIVSMFRLLKRLSLRFVLQNTLEDNSVYYT
jgi:hypothetical protein